MPQATVKSYDSLTKTGVLVADDGTSETPFEGEALGMFRFLRPGQRVTYDVVVRDGESRVLNLRIGIA
jgi:cold shock CspA family protein